MVVKDVHDVATQGFHSQTDAYEQGRPSYPPEAIAAVLDALGAHGKAKVLDLASGTGKFTRLLAAQANLNVVAVEPNDGMRAAFEKLQSAIPCYDGSATSIPFDDGTFDGVFVAQGFHWFANEAALREMHRVLKPGGVLGFIWNREDDSIAWQKELLQIFEPLSIGIPQYWTGKWKEAFDNDFSRDKFGVTDRSSQSHFFRNKNTLTREDLWSRLLSRSYIAALDKPRQDEVQQALNDLLKRHPSVFNEAKQSHSNSSGDEPLNGKTVDVVLKTELFLARSIA